jgi:hypothetical protein
VLPVDKKDYKKVLHACCYIASTAAPCASAGGIFSATAAHFATVLNDDRTSTSWLFFCFAVPIRLGWPCSVTGQLMVAVA